MFKTLRRWWRAFTESPADTIKQKPEKVWRIDPAKKHKRDCTCAHHRWSRPNIPKKKRP